MSNNNVLSILPLVSILTAAVFICVHVASSGTKPSSSASNNENVGGGPGGLVSFTYTPTTAPNSDLQFVPVPTAMVFAHNIPQISDLVPTAPPKPQLVNNPPTQPTIDSALLNNNGSPQLQVLNIPLGQPTPDPALLPTLIGSPLVQYSQTPRKPHSTVRPLEFGTSAPSINSSPSLPSLPVGKPTKSPTKKPSPPKRSPTVSPVLSPPVFRPTTSPGPSSLPYGGPAIVAPTSTRQPVAKPSRPPATSVAKTPSPTKGVPTNVSPSYPSPIQPTKGNAPSTSTVPFPPSVSPPTPLVRPPSPPSVPGPATLPSPPSVPGPPVSPSQVTGGLPSEVLIQTGGEGLQVVIGINVDPNADPEVVVSSSSGVGSNPWWNVVLTVPPTSEPLIAKHNEIFLKGCNPLQCILNETATFNSMSNEDESIYEIFYTNPIKCCRVIVEIGVGNGERHSVSKFFEDALKWRPLLIEANPDIYKELQVNRPNATKINGAFCESDSMTFENGNFHAVGGSIEVTSELHTLGNSANGGAKQTIPCLQMDSVFSENGITKVDVMVIRVPGDALAYIRSMDWTVRVDIWIILMHGQQSKQDRDDLVRTVLSKNEYVQAEWDIKRWCADTGVCLNNEVFLRKGFNPLPGEVAEIQRGLRRNLRSGTGKH